MSDQLSTDLASLRIDRAAPPAEGPSRARFVVYAAIAAVTVLAIWLIVVPTVRDKFSTPKVEVTEIAMVSPAQASTELTATGYVVPQKVSQVAAKFGGRLAAVQVHQGDQVKAGDILMVLDTSDLEATIAAAQARVATARANAATARANLGEVQQQLAREREAAASGVSANSVALDLEKRAASQDAAVKAADAQARAAQAEVDAYEITHKNYTVRSPIDGKVINKPPQVGEMVGPAMAGIASQLGGIQVADFASLDVETDVPEGRLGLVKIGGPAEIVLDAYPEKRYRGQVEEIVPQIDRAKATVMVRVKFVDGADGALPDMSARVGFLSSALDQKAAAEKSKLVVPGAAVTERGGAKVVFVLEGDRLRMMPVELGAAFGGGFELVRGPLAGAKVVKNPAPDLADGKKVKEKNGDE